MKINVGSGRVLKPDWLNIDMIDLGYSAPNYLQRDLKQGLPKFAEPVEYCYSAHCLEHFSFKEGQKLLKSIYETLAPNGVIRLCLPDFSKMVKAYVKKDWEFFNAPEIMHFAPDKQMMQIMNYGLYQRDPNTDEAEHKCAYDSEYACFALTIAGFREAKEVKFDPSVDQDLELRKRYSLYVEAKK